MSVLTQVKITVAQMPTALTLSEVMTAPVKLDIQEMDTHVMVCAVLQCVIVAKTDMYLAMYLHVLQVMYFVY